MRQRVLLVEIQVTSPVGEPGVLRFADRAIAPMPPTDALRPNAGWQSRIQEAPAMRRMLFDNLETMTPSIAVGALTLANADHALDVYEGYAWGAISVLLWDEGTPSATAKVVLQGLCAQPVFDQPDDQAGQVRVGLYDYAREASKTLQIRLYAGSNDGEGILYEGSAEGLKDMPKPLAFGDLTTAHIPAPLVNSAEQAHQLHDGAILGPISLFDRGDDFGLTHDGDLSGAAFDAAAPAAAHSVSDLGRGLVKFNAVPVGQMTAGFKGDAGGGYVETAGPVVARILGRAGVPAGRIGASVASLAAAAVVGFWAGQPITLSEAVRLVAAGAPASVQPDRLGVWQAIPWGPPKATADYSLSANDVLNCASEGVADAPIGEVKVGWGRVWQTFTAGDLAADLVGTEAQTRLANEYRWAVQPAAGVKARWPDTFRTIQVPTALRGQADAQALAAQLMDLLGLKIDGRPRRAWRVTVPIDVALDHDLGLTVALDYPPQGLSGHFLLVGEEPLRPHRDQAIWTLWG